MPNQNMIPQISDPSFIDRVNRLIYRWQQSPNALTLISQEYKPYYPRSQYEKIILIYNLLQSLNHEGLKAVAVAETGIDNFGFDIKLEAYNEEVMTLIFTSESIDPIPITLNITYE